MNSTIEDCNVIVLLDYFRALGVHDGLRSLWSDHGNANSPYWWCASTCTWVWVRVWNFELLYLIHLLTFVYFKYICIQKSNLNLLQATHIFQEDAAKCLWFCYIAITQLQIYKISFYWPGRSKKYFKKCFDDIILFSINMFSCATKYLNL
jgi:hypothetical protein